MASIFTYQEEPPRVHSPWSISGNNTPQSNAYSSQSQPIAESARVTSITKLEPERQDGPTEYKLHLLLRSRKYLSRPASQTTLSNVQSTDSISTRTSQPIVNNSRQARLQQLTTQLLWRLQQSSPFHSSSNASLVLPVLPEATPQLGVPDRPAKLLPGLEESQGALYEIGVADDGTLVGLVEEELEESLNNLRAMAASLGCVVDILRRVLLAQYERKIENQKSTLQGPIKMWVAEVLVRPETKSPRIPPLEEIDVTRALSETTKGIAELHLRAEPHVEQLRIAVIGATTAGKSSLVGTLTTSTLDNGRGKSRLSLLKHRHEIASGVTSSVAQELVGYRQHGTTESVVVNYATGDVSSWPDIHNLASRLCFLSDSPGLPRYAKSTFRTLVSWKPTWTFMCVAADEDDTVGQALSLETTQHVDLQTETIDLSLAHLDICLRLDLPLVVVITKLDIATKSGLKSVLSKILSALKLAGRTPLVLGSPSNSISNQDENTDVAAELARLSQREHGEIEAVLEKVTQGDTAKFVPIVLTSAVTGAGIGKLHALLRGLPLRNILKLPHRTSHVDSGESIFHVDEIFAIPPSKVYSETHEEHSADHGIVLCGYIATGRLAVGDCLRLGPFALDPETYIGDDNHRTSRSASYSTDHGRRPLPRALSGLLSKSLQVDPHQTPSTPTESGFAFLEVHIVSLRSLRLPVRSMEAGETGTVGVQPLYQPSPVPLSRARKGMILSTVTSDGLFGYRSFSAVFPASDFVNIASPTLILGGHAISYVNSFRAAVRVTALIFDEAATLAEPSLSNEVFNFDDDDEHAENGNNDIDNGEQVRITFKFLSSIEWMDIGDQAFVVPTLTASGPISGPPVAFNGLSGFVGRICEVFT